MTEKDEKIIHRALVNIPQLKEYGIYFGIINPNQSNYTKGSIYSAEPYCSFEFIERTAPPASESLDSMINSKDISLYLSLLYQDVLKKNFYRSGYVITSGEKEDQYRPKYKRIAEDEHEYCGEINVGWIRKHNIILLKIIKMAPSIVIQEFNDNINAYKAISTHLSELNAELDTNKLTLEKYRNMEIFI